LVDNNTFRGAKGIGLNVFRGTGGGSSQGTISNNTIGVAGTASSGSLEASALQLRLTGNGTLTAKVAYNSIYQYGADAGMSVSAASASGAINVTALGNGIGSPVVSGSLIDGMYVS